MWFFRTIEPYLSYTVYYIDDEGTLQSHCLQAHFMPESHTGAHIHEFSLSTLEAWNLDSDKQITITTDNASNVKLAC